MRGAVWSAVGAVMLLSACGSGRPDLPSEAEARKFLPTRSITGTTTYDVHTIKCKFDNPAKSAKTDEWMAICRYEMTETKKISYQVSKKKRNGSFRLFWREFTDHSGTKSLWVVG